MRAKISVLPIWSAEKIGLEPARNFDDDHINLFRSVSCFAGSHIGFFQHEIYYYPLLLLAARRGIFIFLLFFSLFKETTVAAMWGGGLDVLPNSLEIFYKIFNLCGKVIKKIK
jgi:hypothetical protein